MGSPVFGYMTGGVKTPNMGQPPYQVYKTKFAYVNFLSIRNFYILDNNSKLFKVTLEERMRWAQLADVMAQANHYAVS